LKTLGEWQENAARCLRRCGRYVEALHQYSLSLDWYQRPGAEFLVTLSSAEAKAPSEYAIDPGTIPPR
jgi:hypothetical protein